jgi:hypothetical protein
MAGGHEMNAVKIDVVIPENRELRVSLPPEVVPGPAEIIVLSERRAQPPRGSWDRIRQCLERTPPARPGKSKEEIDRYLAEERASWDQDE